MPHALRFTVPLLLGLAALTSARAEEAPAPATRTVPPRLSELMGLGAGWQRQFALRTHEGTFLNSQEGQERFGGFESPQETTLTILHRAAALAGQPAPVAPAPALADEAPVRLPESIRPADYNTSGFASAAGYSHARFAADLRADSTHPAPAGFARAFGGGTESRLVSAPPITRSVSPDLLPATNAAAFAWQGSPSWLVRSDLSRAVVVSFASSALADNAARDPAAGGGTGHALAAPNASVLSLNRIADTTTVGPGQSSAFTSFGSFPYVSNSRVAFIGNTGSNSGVYEGAVSGGLVRVADTSVTAPGSGTTFTGFGASSSINTVGFAVFYGTTSVGAGIYVGAGSALGRIADTNITPPGKSSAFTAFSSTPDISGNNVSFTGTAAGSAGIYVGTVDSSAGLTRIVDTSFTAPGKGVAFSSVTFSAISGSQVAFSGTAGGSLGVYAAPYVAGNNTPTLTRLADTNSPVPGQSVNFSSIASNISLDGGQVAFLGNFNNGANQLGLYKVSVDGTGLARVIDTTQNAPGKGTLLTGTSTPSISNGNVAFLGLYNGGSSIFVALADGSFLDVVDTGAAYNGSTFSSFSMSKFALEGSQLSFGYSLANGTSGILETNLSLVPEPGTWAGGALLFLGAGWSLRRRIGQAVRPTTV